MSTYDLILQEGMEKGMEKMIINGYQKGFTLDMLSSMAELSVAKIEKILNKYGLI